jgi:molybdate transport system ATP-binding protein
MFDTTPRFTFSAAAPRDGKATNAAAAVITSKYAAASGCSSRRRPVTVRLRTAAVVYGPGDDVDAALAFSVATLCRAGLAVGGLLQRFGERIAVGKREMLPRVLPGHETIRLNDPRGSGVQGCTLDTDALARAAMAFRQAALVRPDLLLASRFGKEEASGGGMRAELAEALMAGIPVLMPVRSSLLPAWREFLGEPADELPPTNNAILAWAGLNSGGQVSWTEYRGAAPMAW